MQNNLPELRDIHLPEGVSIFPPAYGWFVILAVIFVAYLSYVLIAYLRRKSKKIYAVKMLNNLQNDDIIGSAKQVSIILRKICLFKYKNAVSLKARDWAEFLNNHSKTKLSLKSASLLIDAPYINISSSTYNEQDLVELKNFATSWVGENL